MAGLAEVEAPLQVEAEEEEVSKPLERKAADDLIPVDLKKSKDVAQAPRRRWPKKGDSKGDSNGEVYKLKPSEIHEFSGPAPRDAKSRRLTARPGAYWSEPDASGFKIRGPTYLMDKVKIPVGKPLFFLLDCDLFDLPKQTDHVGRFLTKRIDALWKESGRLPANGNHYTVIIQLQVPGPPWKSFVMYFGLVDRDKVFNESNENDTPLSRIARRFFASSDTTPTSGDQSLHKWRNNTFKLIPRCVNAPFVVKRAVGEVPTLLGNKLQQAYYGNHSYFEVDVNISSSRIAQYTVGLALNYAAVVVCDLAFVLQGASPAELPEQLVGCMRIEHIVMRDAQPLDIPQDLN